MKQIIQNTRHRLATLILLVVAMIIPQVANADVKPSGDGTADAPYEISNAVELYWFAEQVNSGHFDINAVLISDIVVNKDVLYADGNLNSYDAVFSVWTPIGLDEDGKKYVGTFDGQGHTISGLYFNDKKSVVGLFCATGTNSVIKNVGITDSYFKASQHAAGICGSNGGLIDNCFSAATCAVSEIGVGGIVSWNDGTISNCYNIGKIAGINYDGAICANNNGTITNCYYLEGTAGVGYGSGEATSKNASQFASGEVTWLLNGSEAGKNPAWRQTIGEDEYPVMDTKKGIVVYSTQEGLNSVIRPTAGKLVGAADVYNFAGIDGKKVYGIEHTGALAAEHPYVFTTTNKNYVSFVPSDEEVTDNTETCGLTGVLDQAGKKVYGKDDSEDTPVSIVFTATALKYANPKGNTVKYGKCYINAEECFITSEPVAMAKSIANFGDGTTTSIDDIEATAGDSDGKTYNLQGVEVGKDYKGIVIVNGKKMVRK